MNVERLAEVASSSRKNAIDVQKLFAQSKTVSDQIDIQRLRAQSKLLEERKKTYNALLDAKKESDNKDNVLGKLLGTLGLGGLAKGLRGIRKPPMGGGGGFGRLSPKPGGGPRIGAGVVGLNLLFGGIDFLQRRSSGQSNLQAGLGAGASTAGGIGGGYLGGQIGAAIGTAIAPGVGTLIGGGIGSLIGGGIGAYAAGEISDRATGVTRGDAEINRRIREEERRTSFLIAKTPFSFTLDTFNRALDKLSLFRGGICACAGASPLTPSAAQKKSPPRNKLKEAWIKGYNFGYGKGKQQGTVTGFAAGVILVGGVLFLTKGGVILQRLGTATEIFETVAPKTPKITEIPRVDPGKVRVLPKEELPAPKPELDNAVQRIMRNVFGEEPAQPHTPRIPRNPKTGKPEKVEMIEEIIDTPEGQVMVRRPAQKAEKQTPEEFFQNQERKGIKKEIKRLKKIRTTLEPEEVPIGPQSMAAPGGSNLIALAEPNTTIVPVPVGGGTRIVGTSGPSAYEAATKYAQMTAQMTV